MLGTPEEEAKITRSTLTEGSVQSLMDIEEDAESPTDRESPGLESNPHLALHHTTT